MESSEKDYTVIRAWVGQLPLHRHHLQFPSSIFTLGLRKCMVKTTSLGKLTSLGVAQWSRACLAWSKPWLAAVSSIVKQHIEAVYPIASMQCDCFSCLPNASGLGASPRVTTRSLTYVTNTHNGRFSHDHFGFHEVNPWDK